MELKSKVQELEMLEIEIPALVETKEGKLLGGFCTIATTGFDVFAMQDGCETGCQNSCNDSCQAGTCQSNCKHQCQNSCKTKCDVTNPPTVPPTKDTTPTKSELSLVGFSFMF
ncbi:MAG: hypothetical protein UDM12_08175 [Prevotellamassilia sp.]|jgi:hypothetical protein|nr:hypothetical protein [Prevotellamassilia sp.]